MTVPDLERHRPPLVADERAMLDAFLDSHRATLLIKCRGLSNAQLKLRSAEPSTLSLLGLVRHLTEVERSWFRRRVAGETGASVAPLYYSEERPDDDFDATDAVEPSAVFATYLEEVERCRTAVAGTSLDTVVGERSLRWVYLHMLEEYARHNGHADLLRERIDGATGQ
jgi:predicted RNA-binding Zn ribbon-like protein